MAFWPCTRPCNSCTLLHRSHEAILSALRRLLSDIVMRCLPPFPFRRASGARAGRRRWRAPADSWTVLHVSVWAPTADFGAGVARKWPARSPPRWEPAAGPSKAKGRAPGPRRLSYLRAQSMGGAGAGTAGPRVASVHAVDDSPPKRMTPVESRVSPAQITRLVPRLETLGQRSGSDILRKRCSRGRFGCGGDWCCGPAIGAAAHRRARSHPAAWLKSGDGDPR